MLLARYVDFAVQSTATTKRRESKAVDLLFNDNVPSIDANNAFKCKPPTHVTCCNNALSYTFQLTDKLFTSISASIASSFVLRETRHIEDLTKFFWAGMLKIWQSKNDYSAGWRACA